VEEGVIDIARLLESGNGSEVEGLDSVTFENHYNHRWSGPVSKRRLGFFYFEYNGS